MKLFILGAVTGLLAGTAGIYGVLSHVAKKRIKAGMNRFNHYFDQNLGYVEGDQIIMRNEDRERIKSILLESGGSKFQLYLDLGDEYKVINGTKDNVDSVVDNLIRAIVFGYDHYLLSDIGLLHIR